MTADLPLADLAVRCPAPSDQATPRALRVLDLSRGGGAAACVQLLAHLGAEVRPLDRGLAGRSARLPDGFDLVVLDRLPTEARALGLEPHALARAGAVAVSVTPFGLDGPDADRSSGGPILGGCRPEVAASLAGAHAALAGLAALRWAWAGGSGIWAEVAAVEVIASCLGGELARVSCPRAGPASSDHGRADRRLSVLPCVDGYVAIAAPTDDDLELLTAMLGDEARPDEGGLPRLLEPWLRARTRAEVFETAQLWRLPVVPVLPPVEVLADPQCRSRGVWRDDGSPRPVARSPFRFRRSPHAAARPPRPGLLPLSDLSVLDLGMVWAGPYCGRLLAALGAQVTKVEGPRRPDGTRLAGSGECQGIFADLNRGKRSLVIDLATPAGAELFLHLAGRVDVVVENFSPRVMPNFGLDYPALAAANPSLLMLSMPAFGSDGPWANYVAYGSGLELATGLTGWSGGRPAPAAVAYLDYLAGCYGAVGLLAALLARDRSGAGAHVELAQREVACQVLAAGPWQTSREPALAIDPATVATDRHLAARGLLGPTSGSSCEHYGRLPFRLHGLPATRERPAPAFGADSRRVLRQEAGLAPERIEALVRDGVVGAPPGRVRADR